GTDYGVYLLLRNAEEIALGRPAREALEVTAMRAGPGMLGGALAAAGAFYVLMATDFPGIQELGFISGTSVLVAAFAMMTLLPAAGSVDELRERAAAFEGLASVSEVESVLSLIPPEQAAKAQVLAELAPVVEAVAVGPPETVDAGRLLVALRTLQRRLDLAADEAPPGHDRDEVVSLRDQTAGLVRRLERTEPAAVAPALLPLQDRLRGDLAHTPRRLQQDLHPTPIALDDVPPQLRRRFVGRSGRFLLQIQ